MINSGANVFSSGFTEGDSSPFNCRPKWLDLWKRKARERKNVSLRGEKEIYCIYWRQAASQVLTASERYVQGMALYTILVMPACWHRWASTSPTAWHAATQFVDASSFFSAHSLVEQDSTGTGELLENTRAVTWCWVRENSNLKTREGQTGLKIKTNENSVTGNIINL